MKPTESELQTAVEGLYSAFRHYRLGHDQPACDCCVDAGDWEMLKSKPLRHLTYDDLERYSQKAMTTWGSVHHFKHLLPRLFELTIEHRDEFLDLAVVFGKLAVAELHSWPKPEQGTIDSFLLAYWRYQLDEPIVGAFDDSIDTILCAMGNAVQSLKPILEVWTTVSSPNAIRHLAAFVLTNAPTLLSKGQLYNPFWAKSGLPHRKVVDWLRAEEPLQMLTEADPTILIDDFAYAAPQLAAIQSALATSRHT